MMNKEELVKILESLQIPVNEGVPSDENMDNDVIVYFWEYIWDDITASGEKYNTKATYQISFIAEIPRHKKLIELKKQFNKLGLFPTIQHEYDIKNRQWHSFFAIEVLENIE